MWHTLKQIADNRKFNVEDFTEFALKSRNKYGLDDQNMIGTFYVNDLIEDFKNQLPEEPVDMVEAINVNLSTTEPEPNQNN